MNTLGTKVLRTGEAADYVGLKPVTLETLRLKGGGPVYLKLGRSVRYSVADLDEWVFARRRVSTSQALAA